MNKTVYLAWTDQDSRASSLAHHMGAKLIFIHAFRSRSLWLTPLRYAVDSALSLAVLLRERPATVIVVNPPVFGVLVSWLYSRFSPRCGYIVDTHSVAFTARKWAIFLWLYRFLSKRALLNILHNKDLERRVAAWGGPTATMGEIPYEMDTEAVFSFRRSFNVVFVCLFSADEPLREVLEAAARLPEVDFYITGALSRAPKNAPATAPENVVFTDFLANEKYKALLRGGDIIISLTKNDSTMQNGAYEALSLGRPIITSDWPVLRNIYTKGAVCVDNNPESLVRAVKAIKAEYPRYVREIRELRGEMEHVWRRNLADLSRIIEHHGKK